MLLGWFAGSMCYMSGSIQLENIYAPENEAGVWQWLFGKTVTNIVLHNTGSTDGFVGIAASSLAKILPVIWRNIARLYHRLWLRISITIDQQTLSVWFSFVCRLI